MKFIVLITLLLTFSTAQADELRYFVDKKSGLVGVKNHAGKVIIPAQYGFADLWGRYERPIAGHQYEIEFLGSIREKHQTDSPAAHPVGDVYNRDGKFLYTAQWFDNGFDLWSEGKRRFVEKGKIGFVNREGEKIIAAQYDNAGVFELGYARVVKGKVKKQCASQHDCEHYSFVPEAGTEEFVINERGERVLGSLKPQAADDIQIGNLYYPMLKPQNALEHKIMANLQRLKPMPPQGDNVLYTIVSRPTPHFPYYEISEYSFDKPHQVRTSDLWHVHLVADRLGDIYYFDNGFEDEERTLIRVE